MTAVAAGAAAPRGCDRCWDEMFESYLSYLLGALVAAAALIIFSHLFFPDKENFFVGYTFGIVSAIFSYVYVYLRLSEE